MSEDSIDFSGCKGKRITYEELDDFLEDMFDFNEFCFLNGERRWAGCVWGHSGMGKTEKIKQWETRGYKVYDVPGG